MIYQHNYEIIHRHKQVRAVGYVTTMEKTIYFGDC